MYFKFFGKIYIKSGWIMLILSSFLVEHKHYFYTALIMCFLHEMCHFFVACILGVKVRFFIIHLIGFEINTGMGEYKKDLLIAAAGPLGSAVFLLLGYIIGDALLIHTNLSVLLVNLLPALPLDGGRILKIILFRKMGIMKNKKIMRIISTIVSVCMMLFALKRRFLWLVFIAVFILLSKNKTDDRLYCMAKKEKNLPERTVSYPLTGIDYKIINYMSPYYKITVKDGDKTAGEEEIFMNILGK